MKIVLQNTCGLFLVGYPFYFWGFQFPNYVKKLIKGTNASLKKI
jgi:hypothetical protein